MKRLTLGLATLFLFIGSIFCTPYPFDHFIISFNQVPEDVSFWSTKKGYLQTGNQDIDDLNEQYNVTDYKRLFQDTSSPLGRHFIFLRGSNNDDMNDIIYDYEHLTDIDQVWPDYEGDTLASANDPIQNGNYLGSNGCNVNDAWELNTSGNAILVGILDISANRGNNQLSPSLYLNEGEDINSDGQITSADSNGFDDDGNGYIDDFQGWNFHLNSNVIDEGTHGTGVVSILCAQTNDSTTVSGIAGGWAPTMPGTKWVPARINNISECTQAIEYVANLGARVINISMSFGYLPIDTWEPWIDLMDTLVVPNNIVIVAGAGNGNDGINGVDNCVAPGRSSYVISVGATEGGNAHNFVRAPFSNYGDLVDIAAPGVDWKVTWLDSFHEVSGTSFSSPVVAAAAALILGLDSSKTRSEVRDLLLDWATPMDSLGAGQVNVYKSLAAAKAPNAPSITISGYSQTHPVLGITNAQYDVDYMVIQRKLVTNDRYHTVYQDWTAIDTVSIDTAYTDETFGHNEDGPYIAYYRTLFIDIADLVSGLSNTVSTEGYIGIFKITRDTSMYSVTLNTIYPAIGLDSNIIYISDWGQGLYTYAITGNGIENTATISDSRQPPQLQIPISGNYLFAFNGDQSFCAYSIENPDNPLPISNSYLPELTDPMAFAANNQIVAAAGHHPYAGEDSANVLQIVDFSNPSSPQVLFNHSRLTGYDGVQFAPVFPRYVVASGASSSVWDVSDLQAIRTINQNSVGMHQVSIWGNWIVGITNPGLGFWSIDSSGVLQAAPDGYEAVFENENPLKMVAQQDYIACSDDDYLYLYARDEDTNLPFLFRSWAHENINAIAVNDNYLVATNGDSLFVYDLALWTSGIHDPGFAAPADFRISSVYPNPFNAETRIRFTVPSSSVISIGVYDLLGRNISTLKDHHRYAAGRYTISWNAKNNIASGIYFIRLTSGSFTAIKKVTIIK
ncbi:MAG: S8 family peptidase [Candidatus Marinimicrobia bacterium]|nr:S8 family peptidase [Candidatus Neomarinimicrobiota bacterium]